MSGHGAGPDVGHDHAPDDPFTKKVALSVAVLAVILAAAATGGKNAAKDLVSEQLNASNTWNQYQAKSQREVLYQQEKLGHELEFGRIYEPSEAEQLLAELKKAGYKPKEKKEEKKEASEEKKEEKKNPVHELGAAYEEIEKSGNTAHQLKDDKQWRKVRYAFVLTKLVEYRDKEAKESMPKVMEKARGYEAARDKAHKKDPYFDFAELFLQIAIVLSSVAMLSKAKWPYYASIVLALVGLFLTLDGFFLFMDVPFIGVHHAGTH